MGRRSEDERAADAAVEAILRGLERAGRYELAVRLENEARQARHRYVVEQARKRDGR